MEIETDLGKADKFPDRVCQVNVTHCQLTANAMPIFNPVPDGKKTCPRLYTEVLKISSIRIRVPVCKSWFTFLLYVGG